MIDSRLGREGAEIRRRRECSECARRFTTRERVEFALPKIIKRDERREEFDRQKLLESIERACVKRPVSVEAVARMVDRLEKQLQDLGESEVTSADVGERAMEELLALDLVAAARFASVFRHFEGADDFARFFEQAASLRRETDS